MNFFLNISIEAHLKGVYILQNTMVVGPGGNGCWGKNVKAEGVGEKMKKGKRKKEKKRFRNRLKTYL